MTLLADLDLKERVRNAVDLVDLVGASLELRRQGRGFVARCPWHDDRRPSLMVNPERQTWRCWVCDIGGDVFSFIMRRDGCGFPEAMRLLAERAGISIDESPRKRAANSDKANLLLVNAWAEKQFFDCLEHAPEASAARMYLAERGIDDSSRSRFRIGFAPDSWQWLIDRGAAAGHPVKVLEAAGLVLARNNGSGFYDRFRGRLMFPIYDLQGRTIAFGGRVLPGADESAGAKYINSPETPLFSKSRQLYGLNLARDVIRRQQNVLVMEGYTDVILAHQHQVQSAVAVLGTALGEAHIQVLKRFVDRITLVLDGDAAGQRRTDEVLELFVSADVDLRILTLPDEHDPAEFILEHGAAAFNALVEQAPDAIDHKLRRLTEGIDLTNDTHRATAAMESLLSLLAKAPPNANALRHEQLLVRFARTFGVPVDGLRQRYQQLQKQTRATVRVQPGRASTASESTGSSPEATQGVSKVASVRTERLLGADRELFELLIEAPQLAAVALETLDPTWLAGDAARVLLDVYQRLELEGHDLDFNSLMLAVDDPQLKSTLVDLDQRVRDRCERVPQTPAEERWMLFLQRFQRTDLHRTAHRHLAQLESNQLEPEEEEKALLRLIEAQRARHGLMGNPNSPK